MSNLTIFTSPKPFSNPHIDTIQRNALLSWKALGSQITILLIGREEGVEEIANEYQIGFIPDVERNRHGTPLISSIFSAARSKSPTDLYAYVNADIILLPDFLDAAFLAAQSASPFLIVGQRWNLAVDTLLDFGQGWDARMRERLASEGELHLPAGSDYFIFPEGCFRQIPDFAIGRAGWDNWMIFEARRQGWRVINATGTVDIIHQNHDYSHLPEGKPHYRLPETNENIEMAGGPRTIFTLADTNYRIFRGKIVGERITWSKFWREVEIFPLIVLRSFWLGEIFFLVFHPRKAYNLLRAWLRNRREKA